MSRTRRCRLPVLTVTCAVAVALLTGCSTQVTGEGSGQTGAQNGTAESTPPVDGPEPSEPPEPPETDVPTGSDPAGIDGIVIVDYTGAMHAEPDQRVAYDQSPPFGGAHDQVWADCNGTVYDVAVRNEQMVHALEHGTVWIAYHPDQVTGDQLDLLRSRVEGQPYLMLSPYPDLDRPISLQSWGHQLKLDDATDERIDQFIAALRENPTTTPEPGARCDSDGTGFDVTNPPPYDPTEPGPDAMPVDG